MKSCNLNSKNKTLVKGGSETNVWQRNMVRINPFCDSDLRSGLQFIAGVNLMTCGIAIIVDVLAIAEISHFFSEWDIDKFFLPPNAAELLLVLDIVLISFQILCGLSLYKSVAENGYAKIKKWIFPSTLLLGIRFAVIVIYIVAVPVSPYFYYFTSIVLFYSLFMFWPVHRYLSEYGNIPMTENSRLINNVN